MKFLNVAQQTLRLAITRIGPGWMFGLLTFNFNRISIEHFGALAIIITTLTGLHHFISPLQVFFGHLADRYPIFGYRRSPYILLSGLLGALVFMTLPWLSGELGTSSATLAAWLTGSAAAPPAAALTTALLTIGLAFLLFFVFGVAIAANGSSAAALVAETIEEKHRGTAFVFVWMFMIFISIASAAVAKRIMEGMVGYDPATISMLYNLTLPIVLISTLVGLVGIERRVSREEHTRMLARPSVETSSNNAFRIFWNLLSSNPHVRGFFLFLLLAIFGIFLQDAILEVFGAEVFKMSNAETTAFTEAWGQGMIVGIVLIVVLARLHAIGKKTIATIGGLGIALSLELIAIAAATTQETLVMPGLFCFGISTGIFNMGALSLMVDMAREGHTGLYMGMWGLAQGIGTGLANVLSGAFHTGIIHSGLLGAAPAYSLFYTIEAVVVVLALFMLRTINMHEFTRLNSADVQTAMSFETAT